MAHQSNIHTLTNKLGTMHIDSVYGVSKALKALKIDDANTKRFIGPDHQEDDDYYVITCTGVGENSDLCVKLKVKRKRA